MITSTSLVHLLQELFAKKLDYDERDDINLFQIEFLSKSVSLRLPSILVWLQLTVAYLGSLVINFFLALIIYKVIITRNNAQLSFIIGFGVIIPFCLGFPFFIINLLDIRNGAVKFFITGPCTFSLFRTLEALNGFSPDGSKVSLTAYIVYFMTLVETKYDRDTKQSIKPAKLDIGKDIVKFIYSFILLGLYSSILHHYNFELYTDHGVYPFNYSIWDLLSFGHLAKHLVLAVYLQGILFVFFMPFSLIANIFFQIEVNELQKNAIFTAKSPSDFWGKKWNLLLHGMLKRGIFKPARNYFGTKTAVLCTFIASGLFHEWVISIQLFIPDNMKDENGYCENCYYPPMYGTQSLFFIWNGFLVALEFMIAKRMPVFHHISEKLPPVVVSTLLIMLNLPVFHWFSHDYHKSGFFHHTQISLPTFILSD